MISRIIYENGRNYICEDCRKTERFKSIRQRRLRAGASRAITGAATAPTAHPATATRAASVPATDTAHYKSASGVYADETTQPTRGAGLMRRHNFKFEFTVS